MSRRGLALIGTAVAAMSQPNRAPAGVWGLDPVIGIVGDYSTNAELLDIPHTTETDGALLLNAPLTYNGNGFELFVTPNFRVSNSTGYSSVTSDYAHLNVKGEFDTERDVLTAAATLGRDSSLYYDYLSDGGTGVRRDSWTADLNWERLLTERVDFDTDVNTTQTHYAIPAGVQVLTDFKYTSISPTVNWNLSERSKLSLAASVGRYNSLDGTTESRNANLQLGFVRQLTEIWSLTALAGYSRAINRLDTSAEVVVFTPQGPEIEFIPLTFESSQNGTIYSANLSRKGERIVFNASVSRQLTPTGFAYLALQNTAEVTANYTYSDRWSFGVDARYVKAQIPQFQGAEYVQTPKFLGATANWRWTEHWTLSFGASRIVERVQPPPINVASSEVSITISRQFNHIKFQ
jgi:hypothetical protein